VIADKLSSHDSLATRIWLAEHPRIRHAFIPVGACWLNLAEAWWRIFRHHALAGVSFADGKDIDHATFIATAQLNRVVISSITLHHGSHPFVVVSHRTPANPLNQVGEVSPCHPGSANALTKLAGSCTFLLRSTVAVGSCAAIATCLWPSFANY
jgi:hypothetical protein